jgi:hypothetical protein
MNERKPKSCYVTLDCGVVLAAETGAAIYSAIRARFDEPVRPGARIYTRKEIAKIDANLLLCRVIQGIAESGPDRMIELVGIAYEDPHPFLGRFRQPTVPGHFDPATDLASTYSGAVSELKAAVARYLEILV